MSNNLIRVYIPEDLDLEIDQFIKDNELKTKSAAITKLLEEGLAACNMSNNYLQQLKEIKVMLKNLTETTMKQTTLAEKATAASLGNLSMSSFIYKDVSRLIFATNNPSSAKYKYWSTQPVDKIFNFFKKAGDRMKFLKKGSFWKSFEYSIAEQDFKDATMDELFGVGEEIRKKIRNMDESSALRNSNLEE